MSGSCDDVLYSKVYTACNYIQNHMEECSGNSIINYRLIYFCYLNQNNLLAIPLGLACILFYFYVIGDTAEQYLSPTLATMSKFFKMSESFAGATLIAFGNGANDVISGLVANGIGIQGMYLSSSELIGCCANLVLFVSPMVVLLSGKVIQLPAATYGKDCIFLLLTLSMLFSLFIYGKIYWYLALMFPFLYLIYVVTTVIQEKMRNFKENVEIRKDTKIFEEDFTKTKISAEAHGEEIVRKEGNETFVKYTNINASSLIETYVEAPRSASQSPLHSRIIRVPSAMARIIRNRLWQNALSFAIEIAESPEEEEEKIRGFFGKALHYFIVIPWNVLRNITIPPSSKENWNRFRASYFPVPAYLLIVIFFQIARPDNLHKALIALGIIILAILLSLLIYFSTHSSRPPKFLFIFTLLSFIMSLVWLWGWAKLLFELLQVIGIVANIPLEFLCLTILALGSTIPEIATNIAIAKMELSEMALTACVSEPIFTMLIGLGCSMMQGALKYGVIPFDLTRKQAKLPFIGLCILLLTQVYFLIFYCFNKFKMTKIASCVQLLIYAIFLALMIAIAVIVPENDR